MGKICADIIYYSTNDNAIATQEPAIAKNSKKRDNRNRPQTPLRPHKSPRKAKPPTLASPAGHLKIAISAPPMHRSSQRAAPERPTRTAWHQYRPPASQI